jgi:hypothetical protein
MFFLLTRYSFAASGSMDGANGIQKSRLLIMSLISRITWVLVGSARIERFPRAHARPPISKGRAVFHGKDGTALLG